MGTYENIKLKINGEELPSPIQMYYELLDLDINSQRDTQTLRMHSNRGLSDMVSISLVYGLNDLTTISKILKAIEPENFEVELHDLKENARATKTMYASSKTAQFVVSNGVWVKVLKLKLIEV